MSIISKSIADSNPNAFTPLRPLEPARKPSRVVRPRLPRPRPKRHQKASTAATWPAWTDQRWTITLPPASVLDFAAFALPNTNTVGVEPSVEPQPTYPGVFVPSPAEEADASEILAEPDDADADIFSPAPIEPGEGWHEAEVIEAIGAVEARKRAA